MKSFLQEFKAFAMRGNVIDLAVAVIIGTAFNKIVSSLVNNVLMPVLGTLAGGVSLADRTVQMGEATVEYGVFLQSVIDFVIVALAIFVAVKVMNRLKKKQEEQPEKEPKPSEDIQLLRQIRDLLKEGK